LQEVAKIINPMTSTIFWSVVVFAIMVLVLWKFVLKPVNNIISRRQQETEKKIMLAQKQKEEAQKILDQQKEELEKTWAQTKRIIEDSKAEANIIRQQIEQDAKTRARELIENARADIEREKEKSIKEVRDRIADISVSIAQKMLSRSISKKDHQRLIEESLEEIKEV